MAPWSRSLPYRLARLYARSQPIAVGGWTRAAARPCRRVGRSAVCVRGVGGRGGMTALELLTDLRDRGVKLWVDGADLRFSARKGTLGKATAEQLARHKRELV